MREDFSRPEKRFDALKTILITLVVVFVIQKVFQNWIGPEVLSNWFGLSVGGLKTGLFYSFLSYGYLHSTDGVIPWHLLVNTLIIYFVGRHIQQRFGSQRLLEIFHFCVLAGGLVWLPVQIFQINQLGGSSGALVGASSAGYGLLVLFFLERWSERTTILLYFVIPVSFTGKTGFLVITGIQVFMFRFTELNGQSGVAYSAHLGGIGAAYLYFRFLLSRPTLLSFLQGLADSGNTPSSSSNEPKVTTGRVTLNLKQKRARAQDEPSSAGKALRNEVDRILDKINTYGFGSLTKEEKRTLDQAKDKLG
jgi:membrane associated rhomboid family serine protease